jgi:rhomboid family GlyGly-CTERM serine protease
MGVDLLRDRVHAVLASLNCDGRRGVAFLATSLLLLLPTLAGEQGRLALRYDRAGLSLGQYWRLLSAHLVHLDVRHALLNCLGLALVWALFARDYSPRQWLVIVLASIAAIDAGLWLGDSTVLWYVGSSGALHGVMAAGTVAHLRAGEREGWILAALLVAKLAYEQWVGALPLSGSNPVVVDAHLYGVLGGAVAAACLKRRPVPL